MKEKDETCLFTVSDKLKVVWEITHKCDYGCVHCCADAKEDCSSELNTDEVIKGLKNLTSAGLGVIYFSGGEPFNRSDIIDIIKDCSSLINPKYINIATNGKYITPSVASELSNLNVGQILISLDGYNNETAEKFRGVKDCYKTSIKAIENLTSKGIKVRLGVVIWSGNYRNLEDFVKIGINTGVDNIFFNWLVPIGRAKYNNVEVDPKLYFEIANELKNLKNKYSKKINVDFHRFSKLSDDSNDCMACKNILYISPKGNVGPCSWIYKADSSFLSKSSISSTSLEKILQEPPFERFKGITQKRKKMNLGPGCPAMCKIFTGKFFDYDPLYEGNEGKGIWIKEHEK